MIGGPLEDSERQLIALTSGALIDTSQGDDVA